MVETRYKGITLEKNSQIEKSNILIVEFLSSITLGSGGSSNGLNATNQSFRRDPSNLSLNKFNSNQTQNMA